MIAIKSMLPILALSFVLVGCSPSDKAPNVVISPFEQSALNVVSARNDAYNSHDLEAFLATYNDNVRIYNYPDELMGEGVVRLRRIFESQFSENDGKVQVHSQHVVGNIVTIDATESFFGIEQHVVAIYTIENGLITDLRLIEPEKD